LNTEEEEEESSIEVENQQGTDGGDGGNKIHIDELLKNLNKKQRRILSREYERQGNQCCLFIYAFHCLRNYFIRKDFSLR
jgi:hypothetical protein